MLTVYQSAQSQKYNPRPTNHSGKSKLTDTFSYSLTVIDIQNNVIGYEERIADVAAVCLAFGTCYVLTADRRVLHLDERDFRTKLNLLFKQGLYDTGVRIAKNNQYDDEGLAEIFKRYGDHLVARGKHAEACEQYTKTIGHLEPSYVIRAFLDPRHIEHMVDYLKALHERGVATAHHTQLLLNCFTRLSRSDQLQDFLHVNRNGAAAAVAADGGDTFNVDVAIRVCRSSAPDVARTLARQHRRHDAYLAILVEDMQAYADAVAYLRRLPFADCEANVRQFGAVLMEHCAGELTQLLKQLCTFYAPSVDDDDEEAVAEASAAIGLNIVLQLNDAAATNGDGADAEPEPAERIGQRADAVSLMHLFGNRPALMIGFLEHLVANVRSRLPQAIYNALIELYAASCADGAAAAAVAGPKIMDLLQNHGEAYDMQQALVVCRLHEFWPAVLYIYEERGLHRLVVRHHLKQRDYRGLMEYCTRVGGEQPDVWFQALSGLRTDDGCPAGLLAQILQEICELVGVIIDLHSVHCNIHSSLRQAPFAAAGARLSGRRERTEAGRGAQLLPAGVRHGVRPDTQGRGGGARGRRKCGRTEARDRRADQRARRVSQHQVHGVPAAADDAGRLLSVQGQLPSGVGDLCARQHCRHCAYPFEFRSPVACRAAPKPAASVRCARRSRKRSCWRARCARRQSRALSTKISTTCCAECRSRSAWWPSTLGAASSISWWT